jgi:hypothetical protein
MVVRKAKIKTNPERTMIVKYIGLKRGEEPITY